MKRLCIFLLAKDVHANAIAFICALLPMFYIPIGFIAAIIVGLVTLQKGAKSGLLTLAWVALPSVALLLALRQIGLFDVLFVRCMVIWALASLLNRTQAWHVVLGIMATVGVLLIVLLHVLVPHVQQWWVAELTKYLQQLFAESKWKHTIPLPEFAQRIAPIATGITAFFFLGSVLLELFVARFWQSLIVSPGTFAKEFMAIRAGRVMALITCVVVALALFKIRPLVDAFPLALMPFFIAGLSLLHCIVYQKKMMGIVLFLTYACLFFIPALVISASSFIAFLDTWCNFRKNKSGGIS